MVVLCDLNRFQFQNTQIGQITYLLSSSIPIDCAPTGVCGFGCFQCVEVLDGLLEMRNQLGEILAKSLVQVLAVRLV